MIPTSRLHLLTSHLLYSNAYLSTLFRLQTHPQPSLLYHLSWSIFFLLVYKAGTWQPDYNWHSPATWVLSTTDTEDMRQLEGPRKANYSSWRLSALCSSFRYSRSISQPTRAGVALVRVILSWLDRPTVPFCYSGRGPGIPSDTA